MSAYVKYQNTDETLAPFLKKAEQALASNSSQGDLHGDVEDAWSAALSRAGASQALVDRQGLPRAFPLIRSFPNVDKVQPRGGTAPSAIRPGTAFARFGTAAPAILLDPDQSGSLLDRMDYLKKEIKMTGNGKDKKGRDVPKEISDNVRRKLGGAVSPDHDTPEFSCPDVFDCEGPKYDCIAPHECSNVFNS